MITHPAFFYRGRYHLASDYNEASYGTRGGALTGLVNGKKLTISAWVHFKARNGNLQSLFTDFAGHWFLTRTAGNVFQIQLRDTNNSILLTLTSASKFYSSSNFYHVLFSVDLAVASSARMYVTDALEAGPTTGVDNSIDLVDTNYYVGRVSGSTPGILLGCLAELFVHADYLDLSIEANRRKFITGGGLPADLGDTGLAPFGAAPLIYLPRGDPTINLGTGGNYAPTGTFPVCARRPGENVAESVAWNPFDLGVLSGSGYAFSNANKTITCSGASIYFRATGLPKTSGKWYWEVTCDFVTLPGGGGPDIGAFSADFAVAAHNGVGAFQVQSNGNGGRIIFATTINGSTDSTGPLLTNPTTGFTYGFAIDLDADRAWVSLNGAFVASGNPAAGTNPACTIPAGAVIMPWLHVKSTQSLTGRFKSADFLYAAPTGFLPWDPT